MTEREGPRRDDTTIAPKWLSDNAVNTTYNVPTLPCEQIEMVGYCWWGSPAPVCERLIVEVPDSM